LEEVVGAGLVLKEAIAQIVGIAESADMRYNVAEEVNQLQDWPAVAEERVFSDARLPHCRADSSWSPGIVFASRKSDI
jgi:hypothetical protein